MRKRKILMGTLLGVFTLLPAYLFYAADDQLPEEEVIQVLLRDVGHQLLLRNHDSTSLVLPVKQTSDEWFELSFDTTLSIAPEDLAEVMHTTFGKMEIPENYLAQVKACATTEVVYSYQMWTNTSRSTLPCLGRDLPRDCYTLRVKLPQPSKALSNLVPYHAGAIGLAILLFLFGRGRTTRLVNAPSNTLQIGAYQLDPSERKLLHGDLVTPLTEKEVEILTLLHRRVNHTISREDLQKEVWEDKGVIVGRSLDTYVSKLRKKLSRDDRIRILNIRGIGYKMVLRE